MDFELTKSQKEIQKAAKEFAKGEFDKELALELDRTHEFPTKIWKKAADLGFIGVHYPEKYSGQDLGVLENIIIADVFCAQDSSIGSAVVLASFASECILRFGSDDLKQRFLPAVAEGEMLSSGAFTEPDHGSDITSLDTTAVKEGDEWIINGTKTWTTLGHYADWIFCLVRTSSEGRKQEGISFLLFDMASPGVSTAPIQLISGSSPFCETRFDNVEVPVENRVGEEGKGWEIAKYLLTHEREMIGGLSGGASKSLSQMVLESLGLHQGRLADPLLRADLLRLEIDQAAFALTAARTMDEARAGQGLGSVGRSE